MEEEKLTEVDELAEQWLKLILQGLRPDWHTRVDLSEGKEQVAATIGIDWETYTLCCYGQEGRKWQNGLAVPAVRRAAANIGLEEAVVETVIQVFF